MILKNGEPIPKEELAELTRITEARFPDFKKTRHQIVKYHQSRVKADPLNKGKVIRPALVPISPECSIDNGSGYNTYRYYKTRSRPGGKDSEYNYMPDVLIIGPRYKVSDFEELMFLYNFCPQVEQGLAPKSEKTIVMLTFENIAGEAAASNATVLQQANYTTWLYGQMSEAELRVAANRYAILGSETMDIEPLKGAIDRTVRALPNGIQDFMAAFGAAKEANVEKPKAVSAPKATSAIPEDIEGIATLNKLYHEGVITHGTPANKWAFNGEVIYHELKKKEAGADNLHRFLKKNNPEKLSEILSVVLETA